MLTLRRNLSVNRDATLALLTYGPKDSGRIAQLRVPT